MAFRQGRFAEITVSGVSLSVFCDSVDIDRSVKFFETTTFTKTGKTWLPDLQDGKVDIKGKYDPTASTGPTILGNLLGASNSVPCSVYPGGNVAGQQVRNFNAYVQNYKESASVGDVVSFDASLLVDGFFTASGI